MVISDDNPIHPQGFHLEQIRFALLAIPFLGAIIAITYDVGYFSGIDIRYFSFFSISEHIVFAMEFITYALSIAGVFIVVLICLVEPSSFLNYRRIPGMVPLPSVNMMIVVCVAFYIFGIIALFDVGSAMGSAEVNSKVVTHVLNEARGRLIRGGERGVLFVADDPKSIQFFRWEEVKLLKSAVAFEAMSVSRSFTKR
jgi:hypothetical protein